MTRPPDRERRYALSVMRHPSPRDLRSLHLHSCFESHACPRWGKFIVQFNYPLCGNAVPQQAMCAPGTLGGSLKGSEKVARWRIRIGFCASQLGRRSSPSVSWAGTRHCPYGLATVLSMPYILPVCEVEHPLEEH